MLQHTWYDIHTIMFAFLVGIIAIVLDVLMRYVFFNDAVMVLSWVWRYSWSSVDRKCFNYIWVNSTILLPTNMWLLLEVWQYVAGGSSAITILLKHSWQQQGVLLSNVNFKIMWSVCWMLALLSHSAIYPVIFSNWINYCLFHTTW